MFSKLFSKSSSGQEVTLSLSGLHCTSCALTIDDALEDTPGIIKANTSYAGSLVKVTFNPEKVSVKQIQSVINAAGYRSKLKSK